MTPLEEYAHYQKKNHEGRLTFLDAHNWLICCINLIDGANGFPGKKDQFISPVETPENVKKVLRGADTK
jgi:hypothetical protein